MKTKMNDDIRFGTRPHKDYNSDIKTYTLSQEELAKYGSPKTVPEEHFDHEALDIRKVRDLSRTTLMSPSEIAIETGVPMRKVKNIMFYERDKHYRQKRRKGGWV